MSGRTRSNRRLSCEAPGCIQTASACSYLDRRGRSCLTAWCWDHGSSEDGTPYCRRHASTVAAVAGDHAAGLPDVDNRAASLVSWVGHAVDARMRRILLSVAPEDGGKLACDGVRLQLSPKFLEGRSRRWTKVWKVLDHTGVLCAVSIETDEDRPEEICARVDGRAVGNGVPPWIAFRAADKDLSGDEQQAERSAYYNGLLRSVASGLVRPAAN